MSDFKISNFWNVQNSLGGNQAGIISEKLRTKELKWLIQIYTRNEAKFAYILGQKSRSVEKKIWTFNSGMYRLCDELWGKGVYRILREMYKVTRTERVGGARAAGPVEGEAGKGRLLPSVHFLQKESRSCCWEILGFSTLAVSVQLSFYRKSSRSLEILCDIIWLWNSIYQLGKRQKYFIIHRFRTVDNIVTIICHKTL